MASRAANPRVRKSRVINPSPTPIVELTIREDGTIVPGKPECSKSIPQEQPTATTDEKSEKRGTLTMFTVNEGDPRLINVEYPGFVHNPVEALRTMGGSARVSNVLADPKKKLEVRFRPADIHSNAVLGEGDVSCGVLLKVRRRKEKKKSPADDSEPEHLNLIKMDMNLPEPLPAERNPAFKPKAKYGLPEIEREMERLKSPTLSPKDLEKKKLRDELLKEEALVLNKREDKLAKEDRQRKHRSGSPEQMFVDLPPEEFRPSHSGLTVEVLGLIHRTYKFKGLCDFQYLASEFDAQEKCQVSVAENIAPIFGDPDNDILFMQDTLEPNDEVPLFLTPAAMSRQDKPLTGIATFLEENRTTLGSFSGTSIDGPTGDVIRSTRAKRVVYSHNVNFRLTDNRINSNEILVPQLPMPEAMKDVGKKMLGQPLDAIKKAFARRPIWTKLGLEAELGIKVAVLKYLVPCVAYFCLNGPWRSLWVRFGYDPRKDKSAFIYQLLDYRIPHAYRSHCALSRKDPASFFAYKPGEIPPKTQMFYQLCDVHLPEIDSIVVTQRNRISSSKTVDYTPKFGFIDEDTLEYCRYCISRYVELFLFEKGKIPVLTLVELEVPPGLTAPKNMAKLGIARSPNVLPRMRNRPRRYLRRDTEEESSSRMSESDNSSVVGDLTLRGDLLHSDASLDAHDFEWEEDSVSMGPYNTNDESDEDDEDPVMQEILGN